MRHSGPQPFVRATGVAVALAFVVLLTGCGDGGEASTSVGDNTTTAEEPSGAVADRPVPPPIRKPPCPDGAVNCERASGQIAFVQHRDPDGDGDAHFVLVSEDSITAPGISVIDVRADLRPDPLPRPGDMLAASGPVYEGSYGQRQIEADVVRFARR